MLEAAAVFRAGALGRKGLTLAAGAAGEAAGLGFSGASCGSDLASFWTNGVTEVKGTVVAGEALEASVTGGGGRRSDSLSLGCATAAFPRGGAVKSMGRSATSASLGSNLKANSKPRAIDRASERRAGVITSTSYLTTLSTNISSISWASRCNSR